MGSRARWQMRVGIIGAGSVGTALGRGLAGAGHEVVFGVRDVAAAKPFEGARADTVRGAVGAADAVLLATPWAAVEDALSAAGDLSGKVLIDATNPIGPGFTLALGHTTSGAERVASLAKGVRVVKAFNTTGHENMSNPRYGERRVLMPVAGDDEAAVALVAGLAKDVGFDAVSFRSLARARDLEPLAMLWITLAMKLGHGRGVGFGLCRRTPGDAPPAHAKAKEPKSITVLGAGNIGGALARAWVRSGHRVTLAVRDQNDADVRELVALGARAVAVSGSAQGADVVALAVPAGAAAELARSMGSLEGKVVVDCTNAISKGFTLQFGHTTSSAEELAKALPGARLVRAFNQQGAETLQNPLFSGLRATNFVAGDDAAARAAVSALGNDVGLENIETGPLSSSRYLEPITLLWVAMSQVLGTREFGLSLLRR